MNPTIALELARQEHSQRLAHSHLARVRAAARHVRPPAENIGRPPDPGAPRRVATTLVGAVSTLIPPPDRDEHLDGRGPFPASGFWSAPVVMRATMSPCRSIPTSAPGTAGRR